MARHILSLVEVGAAEIVRLARRANEHAAGKTVGERSLEGKVVGIFFRRSSTRTRTSFTAAALRLGAQTIAFGPDDLQLTTGETVEDTGRVLSGYLDALVVRTNDPQAEMEALARQDRMSVVNAMSAEEHPTQALADFSTIQEALGRLEDVHLLYLGEGNNSASALAFGLAHLPNSRLTLMTPQGYGLPAGQMERARKIAATNGTTIEEFHDMAKLPTNVDVVYTTRWHTMGVSKADPDWRDSFLPFTVTSEVMERASKPEGTIFMHDLPAVRGDDVVDEVLDGPQSLAWRQAEHKMWSAMAILEWCLADG